MNLEAKNLQIWQKAKLIHIYIALLLFDIHTVRNKERKKRKNIASPSHLFPPTLFLGFFLYTHPPYSHISLCPSHLFFTFLFSVPITLISMSFLSLFLFLFSLHYSLHSLCLSHLISSFSFSPLITPIYSFIFPISYPLSSLFLL